MKKKYLIVMILMNVFLAHAQESGQKIKNPHTQPNGVVVYEAPGVEKVQDVKPVVPARTAVTLSDLSLQELEERLYFIDEKIKKEKQEGSGPHQITLYEEQRKLTAERIRVVKNHK